MAIIAAGIGAAASIFGASSSAKSSQAAANAQKEAAALQTLVARELHDHWKNYYRQCDINMINEVCATPPYVPAYDAVMGRTRAEVLREFGRARAQVTRSQSIYCVGQYAQQCNFLSGIEAIALADQTNFGYRREETKKIQLDQVRLENIYRWLGLGRNLLSQSNAASLAASAAATRLGAQAAQGNSWLTLAGFLLSKEGKSAVDSVGSQIGRLFGGPSDAQKASSEANNQWDILPPASPSPMNSGTVDSTQSPPPESAVATGQEGSLNQPIYGSEGE